MNRFKYEAYLQEFPFLREILSREEKKYVLASRNKPGWREEVFHLLTEGWRFSDPFTEEFFRSGEEPPEVGRDIWLKRVRIISPREIDSIKIRRADENLLRLIPAERYYGDGLEQWEKIHFVQSNGEIIQNAVARNGKDYPTGEVWKGETILEVLAALPDPDNVKFIVREYYYNGWYGEEYVVEIYKPPKRVKYSDLITKAREKARAEVKTEADF